MKKVNDSHLGLAILGVTFAVIAAAYVHARSQRLDTERDLADPVNRQVAEGAPTLILRRKQLPHPPILSHPRASALDLVDRAREDLLKAGSSISAPMLKGDPGLEAARRDLTSALKHLYAVRDQYMPSTMAVKAASFAPEG